MAKHPSARHWNMPESGGKNSWPVEEARSRFDEFLEAAANDGPQTIMGDDAEFTVYMTRRRDTSEAKRLLLNAPCFPEPSGSPKG